MNFPKNISIKIDISKKFPIKFPTCEKITIYFSDPKSADSLFISLDCMSVRTYYGQTLSVRTYLEQTQSSTNR